MTPELATAASAGSWLLGDRPVNRIGLGAMRLTGSGAFHAGRPSDREQSIAVLRRAVELGVNHIDTAAFYFSALRSANELINRALAPYTADLVIGTKVGPARDLSGAWGAPATPRQLRGQVEENLRQLGRDHLDVVNLRVQGASRVEDHFGALAQLRDAGLIRHLGVSSVTADQLAQAQSIAPVVCVQNPYGLGFRSDTDELVRLCRRQDIAFVPYFAIAGEGREAGAVSAAADEVSDIAKEHRISIAQLHLAWALQQGSHVLVIPGTSRVDHLESNVAAAAVRLSPEEMDRLNAAHRLSPVP